MKIIMALIALSAGLASANIFIEANFALAQDHLGNAISQGDMWALIIDVDGDGLAGVANGSADTFLVDAQDCLAGTGAIANGWSVDGVIETGGQNASSPFAGYDDKAFYLVWFEGVEGLTATQPGANTYYGVEFANINTPTGDTGTAVYANYTNPGVLASYQTVPEPATALLALIGGGLAYVSRRAKRHHTCLS